MTIRPAAMDETRLPRRRHRILPLPGALAAACLLLAGAAAANPSAAAANPGAAPEPTARERPHLDPGAPVSSPVDHAIAVLHPTAGNAANGIVRLRSTAEGVIVDARVAGLAPGSRHAYHVHLLGDCSSADATSAGTHFNFHGPSQRPPADIDRITGNLGELVGDDDGVATASRLVPGARLTGAGNVIGRSVVVHAGPNDPSQPPIGAAGPRIACGAIGIARAPTAD